VSSLVNASPPRELQNQKRLQVAQHLLLWADAYLCQLLLHRPEHSTHTEQPHLHWTYSAHMMHMQGAMRTPHLQGNNNTSDMSSSR
jgi:hypothetical protein